MYFDRVLSLDARYIQLLSRRIGVLLAATCAWAAQATAAHAAEAAAEGGKSYGPPWLVIVLVVALGVFITLRPAGRSGEVKRDLKADL